MNCSVSDYLGMELGSAVSLAQDSDLDVVTEELVSLRGKPGNDPRVIRAKLTGNRSVELTYSFFETFSSK